MTDQWPVTADYAFERRLRGRTFEDHPAAAPRGAIVRMSGPELRHTAGGTSAGTCADSGWGGSRPKAPTPAKPRRHRTVRRTCRGCGAEFETKHHRQVYCTESCLQNAWRRRDRTKKRKRAARHREAQASGATT